MNKNRTVEPIKIEIIEREEPIKLLGCVFYGDPLHSANAWDKENEIGLLWNRFMDLAGKYNDILGKYIINKNFGYEVHIEPDDYKKTKKYYIFVGMEVKEFNEMPLGMYGKTFPAKKYASLTFKGRGIFSGCEYIWGEWLPKSEYEEAFPYMIQTYENSRYHGLDSDKTEMDYLVPIKLKEEQ